MMITNLQIKSKFPIASWKVFLGIIRVAGILFCCLLFYPGLSQQSKEPPAEDPPAEGASLHLANSSKIGWSDNLQSGYGEKQEFSLKEVIQDLERRYNKSIGFEPKILNGKTITLDQKTYEELGLEKLLSKILVPNNLGFEKLGQNSYVLFIKKKKKEIKKLEPRKPRMGENKKENQSSRSLYPYVQISNLVSNGSTIIEVSRQGFQVSGIVTSQEGDPLPGVNVIVQGTSEGTVTDVNGEYSLEAPEDGTLVFSFVGYQSKEIPINERSSINVSLVEGVEELEEVVVVGYGTQKKVNLSGSVSSANMDQISRKTASQTSEILAGEVSGISVRKNQGKPGKQAEIRMRGLGTFSNAGNTPLVLVDGVPSSIDAVDYNNIENISVLKDAASAAIYGSRAANGVILITTKEGKEGSLQVSYDSYVGQQNAVEIPRYADSWTYARAFNEASVNMGGSPIYSEEDIQKFKSGENPDEYPNKHHYKDLMTSGNGLETMHNLTFSGGSSATQWFFSTKYLKENGLVAKNHFDRYNIRLNLNSKLGDDVNLGVKLNGYQSNREEPHTDLENLIEMTTRFSNAIPGRRSDGYYGFIGNTASEAFFDSESFYHRNTSNFRGIGSLEWNIINSLKVRGQVSYGKEFSREKTYMPVIDVSPDITFEPSELTVRNSQNPDLTSNLTLNYDNDFGSHHLEVLGGYSQETYKNEWLQGYRRDFPNNRLYELSAGGFANMQSSGNTSEWSLRSFFGRMNYSFKGKYLFEANTRYDGSSRFAEGNRYGLFPSFSAAWRISEENFFTVPWIENLKIRGSYGNLGNQQIGSYPYQKVIDLGHDYYIGGSVQSGAALTTLPFENISWETTTITDVGLDVTAFEGKINLTADYYYKKTSDILFRLPVANILGMSTSEQNAGAVENKGWEFELSHKNSIGPFSYKVTPNFSIVSNKVLDLGGAERAGNSLFVGEPLGAIYGFETEGLFIDQEDIDNYPEQPYNAKPGLFRFKDISGPEGVPDGRVTQAHDRTVIGSTMPNYMYGMGVTAKYKGFDLYLQFQGEGGNEKMPRRFMFAFNNVGNIQEWQWEERWTEENPDRFAKYPRLEQIGGGSYFRWNSEYWLLNGTYLRMKNVQLGYTLSSGITENTFINRLRFYVSGRNLLTFDNYGFPGWDPEMTTNGPYPLARLFTVGINANF